MGAAFPMPLWTTVAREATCATFSIERNRSSINCRSEAISPRMAVSSAVSGDPGFSTRSDDADNGASADASNCNPLI
jgi:hypothetical protein